MKNSIFKRILSTLLTLALLGSLLPAALAEGEPAAYDNSDLGDYYSTFDCYLGCDQLYEGALQTDADAAALESPVPIGSGALQGIGTFIASKTADYLFNKALDKLWGAIFGEDKTAEQLEKIIAMLEAINDKLNQILTKLTQMEYGKYINDRMKDRTAMFTAVQLTLGELKDVEDDYNDKKN